eukprot:m.225574 g.225574  ORF g.225574 m.225574 type:complete len:108 (-) comp11284_c0_seq1:220-543(-)
MFAAARSAAAPTALRLSHTGHSAPVLRRVAGPSNDTLHVPSVRYVHTFGHPSSGGPLVRPVETSAPLQTSFAEHAGQHARSVAQAAPRRVARDNIYGEQFFGDALPF